MRKLAIAFLALAITACGSALDDLAAETCEDLEDSIVLTAALIVSSAIEDAEDLGFSAPELGDAMREQCPEIMAALEQVGTESEEREQQERDLMSRVDLETDRCTTDGYSGTVTNNSGFTVDVTIEVEFLGRSNLQLDTSVDFVRSLSPGQTAQWDVSYFGNEGQLDSCRAEISSVRES